jgi:2-dehydropantoate 2-reductase
MTTDSPVILIIGAGAIGALYGSALARAGARVSVVCRSDFEVVKRDGYQIDSPLLGQHRFRPQAVYREAAECVPAPDYVILTSKVLEEVDRAALIRPAVGPGTVIVLIQNGIDIEAEIASAFPDNELLSSLAFIAVGRGAPGVVNHQSQGALTLGHYPSGVTPAAQRLAALFEASKVPCKLTDDVVRARWQKAVWNGAFNPLSITGGVLDTSMMLKSAADRAFVRQLMEEIGAIAAANGHPQHPQLIDKLIEGTAAMPPYKTSMALDYENGRPMELEAILGNVVRAGRKAGVPMPALESLYAIAKMIEGARAV